MNHNRKMRKKMTDIWKFVLNKEDLQTIMYIVFGMKIYRKKVRRHFPHT